ncbi:MAG: Asp-tRNA(Asn)/Glu-tRNA(Gln) amidotransferase subunit GatC [Candidatus Pacebacteria bacterium]|nr:Asp-tRNA(Asn)/Glu-tRNA(Gln) amidotransferase subunit GatC [Candidatus Paceibacterota bacterium]
MIDKNEVLKIMNLSRLKIEDSKIDKFQKDFSEILNYVSELKEADTENIPEMSHSIDVKNVEREDLACEYNGINLIPKEKQGYLVVKKILKDE